MPNMGAGFNIADPLFWLGAIQTVVIFLISLTVHEYAHARVAYALGDDTAARKGRMTLNPLVHIDIIGTIVMPILGSAGVPVIGWAKPVPVNPLQMTRKFSMRTAHALVALAGPVSNVILALTCTVLLWATTRTSLVPDEASRHVTALLSTLVLANVGLAVFNMLPIPPLDGSRLMPRSLDWLMEFLERYIFLVFMVIILFGGRFLTYPVVMIVQLLGIPFDMDILGLYQLTHM
jgi:Zn-dependent protease